MKAIRVHKPGNASALTVDDIPTPVPAKGEVLVEVEAAGINFIEIYQREGIYPIPLPFTVGAEAGGIVRATGEGVTELAVGDRVVSANARGAYADFTVIPADRAVRIPDGVSTRTAVAVCLQGLTAHYLATSTYPLGQGDRCLIHAAAGGVGLLFCQIARKRGAFVIGTASSEEKRALAREAGANEVIDYTTLDFATEVRRITGGEGVHAVFDSVGKTTFDRSIDCLVPRGMMVLFGQSSGVVPPMDPQLLARKGSLFFTRPTLAHYVATREALVSRTNELLGWVADGSLTARIGAEFPLDQAAAAHQALESRSTTGKVLLVRQVSS